jgi:hypothetical protein
VIEVSQDVSTSLKEWLHLMRMIDVMEQEWFLGFPPGWATRKMLENNMRTLLFSREVEDLDCHFVADPGWVMIEESQEQGTQVLIPQMKQLKVEMTPFQGRENQVLSAMRFRYLRNMYLVFPASYLVPCCTEMLG